MKIRFPPQPFPEPQFLSVGPGQNTSVARMSFSWRELAGLCLSGSEAGLGDFPHILISRECLPKTQNVLSQGLFFSSTDYGCFSVYEKPAQISPWWAQLGSSFGHLKSQTQYARQAEGNCSRESKGGGYSQFLAMYQP